MSIEEILNCNPEALIMVLITAFVSNWFSYKFGRHNKRVDEFNVISYRIFDSLKSEAENPDPLCNAITEADFNILLRLMYPWQRKGFSKSFYAYKEAQGGDYKFERPNSRSYKNPEPVAQAAAKLLPYLKRR